MSDHDTAAGIAGFGRKLLLALGGSMVLLGGILGLIVGANGGGTVAELTVAGPLTVPVTPFAMALYGMTVVGVALGSVYGLVTVASRFDSNAQ
ncbi:MAG: hypothetical protein A07HN63_01284 [uncultured archaeon A07HN63]|nr:MAG: hypothetical protein A07HN63_01284 [uncultured archaeon A07HN63]